MKTSVLVTSMRLAAGVLLMGCLFAVTAASAMSNASDNIHPIDTYTESYTICYKIITLSGKCGLK